MAFFQPPTDDGVMDDFDPFGDSRPMILFAVLLGLTIIATLLTALWFG